MKYWEGPKKWKVLSSSVAHFLSKFAGWGKLYSEQRRWWTTHLLSRMCVRITTCVQQQKCRVGANRVRQGIILQWYCRLTPHLGVEDDLCFLCLVDCAKVLDHVGWIMQLTYCRHDDRVYFHALYPYPLEYILGESFYLSKPHDLILRLINARESSGVDTDPV